MDINFQTALGGLSTGYKLMRFAYRVYLRRPAIRTYRFTKWLYGIYYAWRHRPPSPEAKARAVAELRAALATIDQAFEGKYDAIIVLGNAARALKASARYDPSAQIIEEVDGKKFLYNHDILAAQILFLQAGAHLKRAEDTVNQFEPGVHDGKDMTRRVRRDMRDARRAIQKAVEYQPNNVLYLNRLIHTQVGSNKREARRTLKKVLALDPGNVEAITIKHRYRL